MFMFLNSSLLKTAETLFVRRANKHMNIFCLGSQVNDYIIHKGHRFAKSVREAASESGKLEELGLLTQFWQKLKPRTSRIPTGEAVI